MKRYQCKFMPISVPWKKNFNFIRKGIIGDSTVYFNDEDNEKNFQYMIKKVYNNNIPNWLIDLKLI
jgi:hypothetical protein